MAGIRAKRKMKAGEQRMPISELERLAGGPPLVAIDHLYAGYGRLPVLHDLSLRVARGRSLCLVRPNGAGKSTVLNAIYGFARVFSGTIMVSGNDASKLAPSEKLEATRLAYVLQKDSVFPDITVEENLLMGGYLRELPQRRSARQSMCWPAILSSRRAGTSAPACCRAGSGGCSRSRAR